MSGSAAPPQTPALPSRGRAYLLLAAVILLWGANWPVMKVGVTVIPPLWFVTTRLIMGAATLFLVLWLLRRPMAPPRRDLGLVLSVGWLQMAAFMALVNLALVDVEAGRSAILAYTTPFWVTPAAVLLLGERLTPMKLAGLGLGLGGVVVLFNPLGFDWSDAALLRGNALLLAAAFAWSIAILHVRGHRWHGSPLQLAPWQMVLATPPLAALAWWLEGIPDIAWSGAAMAVLAYNGPIATAFCFWGVVTVTRALPAITTSLGFLGVPLAGVVFSALALGEPLTATLIGGLVLIVAGMAFVNVPETWRRRR